MSISQGQDGQDMQHAWRGQKKDAYKTKVRKHNSLARPRQRWENDIKIFLQETKWEDVDFIHLVQDKERWWTLMKTVMNLQVP
jgi:hypothetical protein